MAILHHIPFIAFMLCVDYYANAEIILGVVPLNSGSFAKVAYFNMLYLLLVIGRDCLTKILLHSKSLNVTVFVGSLTTNEFLKKRSFFYFSILL